jgi:two-component system chemotaxis response regulator CheB
MPREAIRRGAAKSVAPLDAIAATVAGWVASNDPGTWH